MKKLCWLLLLFALPLHAAAQSPCGPPVPGSPHVCLTWLASPTAGVTYNVYRATTAGGENYGVPLNAVPIPNGTLYCHDLTVAPSTTYYYTVTAVGTGGVLSTPTAEVSVQVPTPPGSPGAATAVID